MRLADILATIVLAIDDGDPRVRKALQLLHRGGWLKCYDRERGRRVYGIPSQSRAHLFHLTTLQWCSCEDHQFRTDRTERACKHRLAAMMQVALAVKEADRRQAF